MVYPKEQLVPVCQLEQEQIRYYGGHTLAFCGLAPENLHFLVPNGEGLVNYRLVDNVAVVLGDPVCPPEAIEHATRSFLDFCASRNWHVAFYQAYSEHLPTYRTPQIACIQDWGRSDNPSTNLYTEWLSYGECTYQFATGRT